MFNNVEDLLNAHGIIYFKNGDDIKCICPNKNHNDKNIGSFSFNIKKGVGHCFACGFSLNLYQFNKLLGEEGKFFNANDFDFNASVRLKKEKINYSKPIVYGKLYDVKYNSKIMDFLHNNLGWSDEFINVSGVKYTNYCEMISEDLIYDANEKPTVMKDRICIPIFKDGNLVNYECRTFIEGVEPKVKYVRGCSSNLIYRIDDVDYDKPVVVTESIKNLGKGWKINKNIISTFGNQISDVKIEMLNHCVKNLILFADFDQGGLHMLQTLKDKYEGDLKVTFCSKKYKNHKGEIKGYDMNDCSLEQIEMYLQPNNLMNAEKAIRMLNGDSDEYKIFWL